ncbi:MAG: hypothetical protein FWH26_07615 [Oscillospiraceae bacterium]|nr:hypothetical protein [Oscillospiraceae bacterium]
MNESIKLLKRFALASLLCLCVTAMVCGGVAVDENTRRLAFGTRGRQVGVSFDRETTTLQLGGGKTVDLPPLMPVVQAMRYAPAPVGCWVMVCQEAAGAARVLIKAP